jgi:drug/metabolite transporter (DMT)-like permease
MLPAILTTFLWSCSAICAARSARLLGGPLANVSRMTFATAILAIWAHAWGGGLGGAALPWFLFSGIIGFGLGDLALFGALQRIGPRLTMVLTHCLAAPLAACTEWLWLGTTLGWREVVCAVLILAGVVLALAPDRSLPVPREVFWIGVLFGIGSACGQGFGSVISTKAAKVAAAAGEHLDGGTAAYQRIVAGLVLTILVFLFTRKQRAAAPRPSGNWSSAWGWVTANALAGPVVGVACYQWALITGKTGVIMPIVATSPVVTQLLVWAVDGERPTRRTVLGGVVAVGGVVALRLVQSS